MENLLFLSSTCKRLIVSVSSVFVSCFCPSVCLSVCQDHLLNTHSTIQALKVQAQQCYALL